MNLDQLLARMRNGQSAEPQPVLAAGLDEIGMPRPEGGHPPIEYGPDDSMPGAAGRAVNIIAWRKRYNEYAMAEMEAGREPLPFEEYMKQATGDPNATANPYKPR